MGDRLADLSAVEMAAGYRARSLSPVEVISSVLGRIDRVNPIVNAFVTVRAEEALQEAREAERAFSVGNADGVLSGIPVTIKDMAATAGIRTTFGSRLYADNIPKVDAPIVERLRRAGAIVVAKTTTPELGFVGATQSPLLGVTRNPWDLTSNPGGSSGGAAVAAALRCGPIHSGADAGGSIRIPASLCGVFGIKPSFGLVPAHPQQATGMLGSLGPLAFTVRDAAVMLDIIAGPDHRDRFAYRPKADYRSACDRPIAGLRIAWSSTLGFAEVTPEVEVIAKAAVNRLRGLGCEVEEVDLVIDDPYDAWAAEFYGGIARRFAHFSDHDAGEITPALVAAIRQAHSLGNQGIEEPDVKERLYAQVLDVFAHYDLIATPTLPLSHFGAGIEAPGVICDAIDLLHWSSFTYPFNLTGNPAASVPAGLTANGHPVGLQLVGAHDAEGTILAVAAALEAVAPWPAAPESRLGSRTPHG